MKLCFGKVLYREVFFVVIVKGNSPKSKLFLYNKLSEYLSEFYDIM